MMPPVFSLENIHRQYLQCRRNKRNTINALRFEYQLEENLLRLQEVLEGQTYSPSRSVCFAVTRPKLGLSCMRHKRRRGMAGWIKEKDRHRELDACIRIGEFKTDLTPIQATAALALTPTGLTLVEHARLRWTHIRTGAQGPSIAHLPSSSIIPFP